MSSYKTGHARSHQYWESLSGTMAGNSWDLFIQGTVYDSLRHRHGSGDVARGIGAEATNRIAGGGLGAVTDGAQR